MGEEMRHGWQMSYLLVAHFGDEGKREAEKLLERRAEEHERLLGSFNEVGGELARLLRLYRSSSTATASTS